MGRVWRAVDEVLDRLVAVKEMRIDGLDTEDTRTRRERTLREARATARIDHPNVVRVYDVVDEGERLWIVMELVTGRSLDRIMADEGALGPRATARIGLGLVAALRQVHARGVLHRDIKPGNVLVDADADRAVLTDFGIAAIQDAKALTMVGMLVGSPDYMAPERVTGRVQGPPSDVWSLGATLCAALAGRSPFSRETTLATLHAVLYEEPEIPATAGPLAGILTALLQKEPEARPGLARLESTLHLVAFPPPPPTLPAPPGLGGAAGERPERGEGRQGSGPAEAEGTEGAAGAAGALDGPGDRGVPRAPSAAGGPDAPSAAGGPDAPSGTDGAGRAVNTGVAEAAGDQGGTGTSGGVEAGGPARDSGTTSCGDVGEAPSGGLGATGPTGSTAPAGASGPVPMPPRAEAPAPAERSRPDEEPAPVSLDAAGVPPPPDPRQPHSRPEPGSGPERVQDAIPGRHGPRTSRPAPAGADPSSRTRSTPDGSAHPLAGPPSAGSPAAAAPADPPPPATGPPSSTPATSPASTTPTPGSAARAPGPSVPAPFVPPAEDPGGSSLETHPPTGPVHHAPPTGPRPRPGPGPGVSLTRAPARSERRPVPTRRASLPPSAPGSHPAPPPGEPPGPAVPADPGRGRRRTALIAAVGVVAAGAVAAIVLPATGGPDGRAGAPASTPPVTSAAPSGEFPSPSPSPSPSPDPGNSAPTVAGTSRPPSLPPGAHEEAGGYAWATPAGWRRDVKTGSEVHYTSPDGSQELAAKSSLARGNLMETWQRSEQNAHQGRDYVKIRLEETTYRGHPAVVWEYTFTLDGIPWHARLLGFDAGGKSYQVNTWYQPGAGNRALMVYEQVKESFTVL
ncbi:serine/threonine-protein kinase [Streptomyces actuosus]|uniref:serine/threonine-protein kinase n=1 Tax=Streptomyces actuosus TaxID=1885 RepID=UPI001F070DB8